MQVSEAEGRLKELLTNAGFDVQNPDPKIAWFVFKSFVQEPVNCADDGILFQCGTNFINQLFSLGFVRQFEIEKEDGEYSHLEQLHCEFVCTPTPLLSKLETNLWAYDFENLNEYFVAVESLKEFQIAMAHQKWQFKIEQEGV